MDSFLFRHISRFGEGRSAVTFCGIGRTEQGNPKGVVAITFPLCDFSNLRDLDEFSTGNIYKEVHFFAVLPQINQTG